MRIILSVLFMMGAFSLCAQKYLYIKKGNAVPSKRIGLNEGVTFKTEESAKFMRGIMNDVNSTTITINNKLYLLDDIQAFRSKNELLTIGGTAIAGAALLYVSLGLINRIGGSYEGGGFTTGEWIGAASLFGAGVIMRWAGRRTYRKDKGWNWEVIDLSEIK